MEHLLALLASYAAGKVARSAVRAAVIGEAPPEGG
jgi:hypothetical protein